MLQNRQIALEGLAKRYYRCHTESVTDRSWASLEPRPESSGWERGANQSEVGKASCDGPAQGQCFRNRSAFCHRNWLDDEMYRVSWPAWWQAKPTLYFGGAGVFARRPKRRQLWSSCNRSEYFGTNPSAGGWTSEASTLGCWGCDGRHRADIVGSTAQRLRRAGANFSW